MREISLHFDHTHRRVRRRVIRDSAGASREDVALPPLLQHVTLSNQAIYLVGTTRFFLIRRRTIKARAV